MDREKAAFDRPTVDHSVLLHRLQHWLQLNLVATKDVWTKKSTKPI